MPTVTLSSVGNSPAINLNWGGNNPVTALVTLGSTTMTTDFTVQITLDDLQTVASPVWVSLGSSTGSSATHFSSANADASVILGLLYPVAGMRLNSTAISSSTLTLKVIQGEGT